VPGPFFMVQRLAKAQVTANRVSGTHRVEGTSAYGGGLARHLRGPAPARPGTCVPRARLAVMYGNGMAAGMAAPGGTEAHQPAPPPSAEVIEGVCGTTGGGQVVIHVLVEDAAATRRPERGADRGERDVLVVDVEDRPGTMGEVARRIGEAGVNIELVYTTFGAVRLVLGVDDLDQARAAL
jgi:hypothetical protein